MTRFEILWLDTYGREIGRAQVKRYNLSAAITAACNMLKNGKGNSDYAHGFIVRKERG